MTFAQSRRTPSLCCEAPTTSGWPLRSRTTETASQSPSCTCHSSPGGTVVLYGVERVPDPILEVDAALSRERRPVQHRTGSVRRLGGGVAGSRRDPFDGAAEPLVEPKVGAPGRKRAFYLLPAGCRPASQVRIGKKALNRNGLKSLGRMQHEHRDMSSEERRKGWRHSRRRACGRNERDAAEQCANDDPHAAQYGARLPEDWPELRRRASGGARGRSPRPAAASRRSTPVRNGSGASARGHAAPRPRRPRQPCRGRVWRPGE